MVRSLIIKYRRFLIIILHALLAALAFTGAFLLRFEGALKPEYFEHYYKVLPFAVILKLLAFWRYRLYEGLWKYVGANELVRIFKALAVSSALLIWIVIMIFGHEFRFPRGIYVTDFLLAFVLIAGIRGVNRLYRENLHHLFRDNIAKRTVILGAEHTGDMAMRMLKSDPDRPHDIVAFLDDDPDKQGLRMHDVPIIGPLSQLPEIIRQFNVTDVVIAIPDFSKRHLASLIRSCPHEKLDFHIVPTFRAATSGQVLFKMLYNVETDDLPGQDNGTTHHQGLRGKG